MLVKTPTQCAIKDEFSKIVEKLKQSDEILIISSCNYGYYSACMKKVLERCIGYVLPYFTIRKNKIHHMSRYAKKIRFSVIFYGKNITEEDKICAVSLVKANSINLNTYNYSIKFIEERKNVYID